MRPAPQRPSSLLLGSALLAVSLALGGCAAFGRAGTESNGEAATTSPAEAAVAATPAEGKAEPMAAVLGDALLAGTAADRRVDAATARQSRAYREAEKDRETQRRRDYEQQSAYRQSRIRREITEQLLFERWRRDRLGATAAGGADDVRAAQRLLRVLGYYNGPANGVPGPSTRAAIRRFEAAQGLPSTGEPTPDRVSRMRAAI